MVKARPRAVIVARTPNPTAGLSAPAKGRADRLSEDLVSQFGLDQPGVGQALIHIQNMRSWGVTITPEIAKNCIAHHVQVCGTLERNQQARVAEMSRQSVVYYMRLSDRVKIGVTTNLAKRIESVRPEELLATEPGDREIEQARHRQFADLRTHGEWFRLEPPLSSFIAVLREAEADAY